jgi:hypothetical protein
MSNIVSDTILNSVGERILIDLGQESDVSHYPNVRFSHLVLSDPLELPEFWVIADHLTSVVQEGGFLSSAERYALKVIEATGLRNAVR